MAKGKIMYVSIQKWLNMLFHMWDTDLFCDRVFPLYYFILIFPSEEKKVPNWMYIQSYEVNEIIILPLNEGNSLYKIYSYKITEINIFANNDAYI